MPEMRVSGTVRRVGNGLALLLPAADARDAGIGAGDAVEAVIQRGEPEAFGLLRDRPYVPFLRATENAWRERI